MSKAVSVAKELARLSLAGVEPDPLTNLRLQKLLYYTQAWSLITRESELFSETLEAWRNGPVVPEVYHSLPSGFGATQITPAHFQSAPDLPPSEADFVRRIWEAYNGYSATCLAKMTHQEPPWLNAWGDRPADGCGSDPISVDDMEAYFRKQAMPPSIAEYEHEQRRAEERACELLMSIPQLTPDRLAAVVTSRSASARK